MPWCQALPLRRMLEVCRTPHARPGSPRPKPPDGCTRSARTHSPNRRGPPIWRQLFAQLTHFFAAMLWVAGVLAIIGGLPEFGVAIFIVIVVNALFAFAQEYRAEQAADPTEEPAAVAGHGRPRRRAPLADRRRRPRARRSRRAHRRCPGARRHDLRREPRTARRHLDADRRERARVDRRRRRLRAGTFVVEGEGLAIVDGDRRSDRVRPHCRPHAGHRASRHAVDPRTPPPRSDDRAHRRRRRRWVLRADALPRHADIRRVRVRHRDHGGARARRRCSRR